MSTAATMSTTSPEQAPMSPIFRKVQTETEAPLFRNKHADDKKKKKRFSLRKMMSKIKSSKRILVFNKSASADADAPNKLEAVSATGSPRIEMAASTDDEISSASSEEHEVKGTTEPSSPETCSITKDLPSVQPFGKSKREAVITTKKSINYEIDDEEYVEVKEEVVKATMTYSDVMALLLAGAVIASQALVS